jgi:hypothetical protein
MPLVQLSYYHDITMTARAGPVYIDAKGCKLPHATYMTQKILPALDKKLADDVEGKISGLLQVTGAMLISDGWTSVQSRPIVNALLTTPAGTMFLKALDTSGNVKDADFIADFICAIIEAQGPKNIVAICMDGACTASFPLIEAKYKHVFCFICPAHALDNFMKNVFSDKEKIKMKSIVGEFDWDSNIFLEPFTEAWKVIQFLSNHSIPLSIFRTISDDPQTWTAADPQPDFCNLIKWVETRFASRLLMLERYHSMRIVVEALVSNIEGWIHSKKRNRLNQTNVERLVRIHTNLLLAGRLEEWSATALPWEIELIIDEPEAPQTEE